jgi:hypothetical protein
MTTTSPSSARILVVCLLWTTTASAATTTTIRVPEAVVRTAPFDVAPEVTRVHAGVVLVADDQPRDGWRRVQVVDGRYGFVREAAPQKPASEVRAQAAEPTTPEDRAEGRIGVMFELLPAGTLSGSNASADATFALAVAPFVDLAASPFLHLGVSPRVIFGVKADGTTGESAKQLDLRARLTGVLPLSPRVRTFARLSPGYSIIALPSPPPGTASPDNPRGFVVDTAVGTEVALLPNLFLTVDLGYQVGFQSTADADLRTSYLHLGAGLAVGF